MVLNPSRPRPTTVRPMTDPDLKAIWRPSLSEWVHALHVRTLAMVATIMPSHPAEPDRIAPTRKLMAVQTPAKWSFPLYKTPQRTAKTKTTKTVIHLYSSVRKEMAPSWI